MFSKRISLSRLSASVLMVIVLSVALPACIPDWPESGIPFPDDVPVIGLDSSVQKPVFEDQGTIAVFHGSGCAELTEPSERNYLIRIQDSIGIPEYATDATVFLNGWQLRYLEKDHEVRCLGTAISNIELSDGVLQWEAGGTISDQNADDGFSWCYYYTVLAWNSVRIDALADHGGSDDHIFTNFDTDHTTALKVLPGYIQNANFTTGESVAVLPRGFGLTWAGGWEDHHLLQVAYNLDYSETFVEYQKKYYPADPTRVPSQPTLPSAASYVDSGFVSWETKTIFKDNSLRRDYGSGEIVSALGGRDVGIVQPPYTILPLEDRGQGCAYGGDYIIRTENYVIENVPFEYAVPVLTGWDLGLTCKDRQVTEIGTWISDFTYDKLPIEPAGTLTYTVSSVLRDKDTASHRFTHRVSVLGLEPVVSSGLPVAFIRSPEPEAEYGPSEVVTFQGEGIDPEDGMLSGSSLLWYSDRDGFLGWGNSIQTTLSGPVPACDPEFLRHTITLIVIDSDGHRATQEIELLIGFPC